MKTYEKVLVVGLGEIGSAVYRLVSESKYKVFGYDIDPKKSVDSLSKIPKPVDVIHIAYPYSKDFIEVTVGYLQQFKPDLVIVESTVPVGTTEQVFLRYNARVVHSPVRGKHPNIYEHLKFWVKWVGPTTQESGVKAKEYLESLGLKVKVANHSRDTELAKLWETVYRAVMIAAWQEIHRISKKFNVKVESIAEFIAEVHQVLKDRPVYFPGYIGGHCLIPNTEILNSISPSKLFEFVLESNKTRKQELEDEATREEVEKLKKIFLELTNKEYYKGFEI